MNNKDNRAKLFEEVLMILKDLCESHEVFISLMPPFELSFEMDRDTLVGRLGKSNVHKELESVRSTLWNQHLQDRYELKASSKAPSFTSIDWDIKLKIKDAKLERIQFPYATCRISFQREFEGSPFTLLGGKTFDSTQINFSIDEIEYLIRVFTTIRRHLEEIETEAKK